MRCARPWVCSLQYILGSTVILLHAEANRVLLAVFLWPLASGRVPLASEANRVPLARWSFSLAKCTSKLYQQNVPAKGLVSA